MAYPEPKVDVAQHAVVRAADDRPSLSIRAAGLAPNAPEPAPTFHDGPLLHPGPRPRPTVTVRVRRITISAGWTYTLPLSTWGSLYPGSLLGAEVGAEYLLAPARPPEDPGPLVGLRAAVGHSSHSAREGATAVANTLSLTTAVASASFGYRLSIADIRLQAGGGLVVSRVRTGEGSAEGGVSLATADLLASVRLAAGLHLGRAFRVDLVVDYRHLFLVTPMDLLSLSAAMAVYL